MEAKPESRRAGNGGDGARHTAVDGEDTKARGRHMLPVWFFVGVILLIYGLIILGSGLAELSRPPLEALRNMPPVAQHPAVWWGGLLAVIGGVYVYLYMPKKS
jgi:hypothetical protein